MANLIPDLREINNFPAPLTEGERTLMNVLLKTLDDSWTIYIQPHLNGLNPDIVIFSKNYGLGIFEVKDWNLQNYRITQKEKGRYDWQVFNNQRWNNIKCPFKQVLKYKNTIIDYEIPILKTKNILEKGKFYGVIKTFLYFHRHNQQELDREFIDISKTSQNKYTKYLGKDKIYQNNFRYLFQNKYKYSDILQLDDVSARIINALAYPQHGNTNLEHLNKPLSTKQKALLPNINPAKSKGKRVSGVAGSGKTLVLIHKAVNAALENKQVLIVCYNITMANYLKECVNRLARLKDNYCHRNIQVFHYHYLFSKDKGLNREKLNNDVKSDVILIDEAQDFEVQWIQQLQNIGSDNYHLMLFEDDRQNIYSIDVKERESIPGIIGRPNKLQSSYRIPAQTAKLANMFAARYCPESLSGEVQKLDNLDLFASNTWFNGSNALEILKEDVSKMIHSLETARPDIAILVCTIDSGWQVCRALDELSLQYQKTFESEKENLFLQKIFQDKFEDEWNKEKNKSIENYQKLREKNKLEFLNEERKLRRGYKVGFWMQTGKIKVSTIHSFKGWELSNILVYFEPSQGQIEQASLVPSLLYTAMTRSQKNLTIYVDNNANSYDYKEFVEIAIKQGCLSKHQSASQTNSLISIL